MKYVFGIIFLIALAFTAVTLFQPAEYQGALDIGLTVALLAGLGYALIPTVRKGAAVAVVFTLLAGTTACGQKDVSFATLEEAKQTARENAMFNAQRYRQENILYKGWDIIGRGDSTQMPDCPQGDGWATMEFVNPQRTAIIKVKCSTVSNATGCLEQEDFKTKPFAGEDGHCQATTKVPFPLPKIAR